MFKLLFGTSFLLIFKKKNTLLHYYSVLIFFINFQENFPVTLLFGTTFLLISKKSLLLHSYSGLLLYSELQSICSTVLQIKDCLYVGYKYAFTFFSHFVPLVFIVMIISSTNFHFSVKKHAKGNLNSDRLCFKRIKVFKQSSPKILRKCM